MDDKHQMFISYAKHNVPKYCFMIWDTIKYPELVDVEIAKNSTESFRISYESHTMFTGKPSKELIESFELKGSVTFSFDEEWLNLIFESFCSCSLIVPHNLERKYNIFLCMELTQKDFKENLPMKNFQSKILEEKDYELLSDKRRMYFYQSPATGIFINNKNVSCAFAPHILQNETFSFAIIRDVWTNPLYRGNGFATDVTAHLCQHLFETGIEKAYLWVEKVNIPAIRVYEKLGFKSKDEIYTVECKAKK
ncbi:MAG: GNAT family N-acetyltransferase [Candidatus Heimdallarchaeaceae archaeon]